MISLNDLCKELHFSHLEAGLPPLLEEARTHALTYDAFLRRVLLLESEGRKGVAHLRRLQAARLPVRKTLEEFDFAFQPTLPERLLWELADLAFVQTNTNVLFLGPPGVGKTHLSLALAVKALEAGYSVLFTTLAQLVEDLSSVPHPALVSKRLRRYVTPRVLVLDEIGYTKLPPEQATHLFELVRDRYEHGSIILTSNTSFADWGALLNESSTTQYLTLRRVSPRSDYYRSHPSLVWTNPSGSSREGNDLSSDHTPDRRAPHGTPTLDSTPSHHP